jgi:glycine/D-amino acid oxidase-like deaminating enzyme
VKRASTVVVGAGVIGASVAWHLAARGARGVLVVDASPGPGGGSTGAATGGFRAQFATAINVRLSLLARAKLLAFREEVGADPGYVPAGYLWIAENDAALSVLRTARAVQRAEGLDEAVAVGPDDIARLQPGIAPDGIRGGAFCPTDGYIRPLQILEGYIRAAERRGVAFRWDETVTGFDVGPGGVIATVRTSRGAIACGAVVDAAGAWAGALAALAGVDLPVRPLRRQMAATEATCAIASGAPMTLYCGDGFHFRERDGRVILGAAEAPSNFFLVNGSSGHGVMHAPALGQLAAEIILDGRARALDATPLSPNRFTLGRPIDSPEVL